MKSMKECMVRSQREYDIRFVLGPLPIHSEFWAEFWTHIADPVRTGTWQDVR